jgi:hypothetical protein
METLLSNRYLATCIASFLNIPSTISFMMTSRDLHSVITSMSTYKMLNRCKPNYTINSICKYGDIDIFKLYMLTNHSDLEEFLWQAAICGNLDIVHYVLKIFYNTNRKYEFTAFVRNKAMLYSAQYGHLDVMKYLISQGANIHAKKDEILNRSIISGNVEIIRYLANNGINIHKFYTLEKVLKMVI